MKVIALSESLFLSLDKKSVEDLFNLLIYDDNIFLWSEEKKRTLSSLPSSIEESIEAIEKDHEFLLQGNVFDEFLITDFIALKRMEEKAVAMRPHPYEMVLYFNL